MITSNKGPQATRAEEVLGELDDEPLGAAARAKSA
jgi:hypothetical protein